MFRKMLKSKIHRAKVTEANLDYEGSLTLDRTIMYAADLLPFEQVMVYNISNGERFETYVIEGQKDSGIICLNGAAARKGAKGDLIIIASYGTYSEPEISQGSSILIFVDKNNKILTRNLESWC
ncbi:MAG TPA: aspartate 1-decarboxylase [Thermodesulfobacteriaceae bacterium]|nr:aspartate 1-decarboxylase [Thermodesulfobacteriaceae bacterium]